MYYHLFPANARDPLELHLLKIITFFYIVNNKDCFIFSPESYKEIETDNMK